MTRNCGVNLKIFNINNFLAKIFFCIKDFIILKLNHIKYYLVFPPSHEIFKELTKLPDKIRGRIDLDNYDRMICRNSAHVHPCGKLDSRTKPNFRTEPDIRQSVGLDCPYLKCHFLSYKGYLMEDVRDNCDT